MYHHITSFLFHPTLQAAFRGFRERGQYSNLTQGDNPPVTTVRRFLHLLDQSEADFAEELKVQQLKQKVKPGLCFWVVMRRPHPAVGCRWYWPFNTTQIWTTT